jgi:hypothetical protein
MGLEAEFLVPSHDAAVPYEGEAVPASLRRLVEQARPTTHLSARDNTAEREHRSFIDLVLGRLDQAAVDGQLEQPVREKVPERPAEVAQQRLLQTVVNA